MPLHARSFGSGLLTFIDVFSCFTSVKLVPDLISALGLYGLFYLYSICCVILAVSCYFVMPETTGLSLEEIENMHRRKLEPIN